MLFLLLSLNAHAAPDLQKTADALRADQPDGVGVAIAVVRGERVSQVFSGPVDADTVFEIGSISKLFTSWLLADAAERGVVALDDRLSEHWPTTPKGGEDIRLWQLASHCSGLDRLPPNLGLFYILRHASDPYADYGREHLVKATKRAKVRHTPGTYGAYSNFGAGLLGQVVSEALSKETGREQSWGSWVDERLLGPAGLDHVGILAPTTGHAANGAEVPPWNFDSLAGAGALDASLSGMVDFVMAWQEPTPSMQSMLEVRFEDPEQSIGLGWMKRGDSWWHNGGTAGFASFVTVVPETDAGVVVLMNQGRHAELTEVGFELADALAVD